MTETTTTRPTKSETLSMYNVARAEARKAGDTKKIERLNKALGILLSKNYYQAEKAAYLPTFHSCGCKDWQHHRAQRRSYTGPCKHMLAEMLLGMIEERRSAHAVPAWVSDPFVRYALESSYCA